MPYKASGRQWKASEKENEMIPFDEDGFREAMRTIVAPWLEGTVSTGKFTSFDGTKIRYFRALNPRAKAVIVMVHGFCEFFGKFHETAYNFWESGYSVYFIEQRGHGGSQRSVRHPDHVDVGDFSEYVEDLKTFLDKVVLPETQGLVTRASVRGTGGNSSGLMGSCGKDRLPLFLYAHSMGGCVSALFLERHQEYFKAAVLSSPMLKMTFGSIPMWQVRMLVTASKLLRWNEQTMPGQKDFDPSKPDFDGSGALSKARYAYQWALRTDPSTGGVNTMNAGTYRWGRAALDATKELEKHEADIRIPLLICQAGKDAYVDNEGQDKMAQEAPHARLVRFPEARHEIYASEGAVLQKYYSEVLGFFGEYV